MNNEQMEIFVTQFSFQFIKNNMKEMNEMDHARCVSACVNAICDDTYENVKASEWVVSSIINDIEGGFEDEAFKTIWNIAKLSIDVEEQVAEGVKQYACYETQRFHHFFRGRNVIDNFDAEFPEEFSWMLEIIDSCQTYHFYSVIVEHGAELFDMN